MEIFSFYFDNFNKKCYNFIIKDKKYKEFWAKCNKFSLKFLCNIPIDKLLIVCYTIITKGQRRQKNEISFYSCTGYHLRRRGYAFCERHPSEARKGRHCQSSGSNYWIFFSCLRALVCGDNLIPHPTGLRLVMGDASIIIAASISGPGTGIVK